VRGNIKMSNKAPSILESDQAYQPALFDITQPGKVEQPTLEFGDKYDSMVEEVLAEAERAKGLQSLGQAARDGFITEGTLSSPEKPETD
jgi:hypothetical protein